ncbi:VOC family protein [Dyella halodurans]|uniref:VOC family protein n=1 Tax=Dyella halodurans TaxID=1920171 RepID=A0ABV9C450_9GAMM|nr:VOC family protein [Dyella halodurans]
MQHPDALTKGIDHVGLTVADLELSRRFFVDCLGWTVVGENPAYPAVFVSDGTSRLTLWQVDASEGYTAFDRRRNIGLHHVALKAPSEEALGELFARVSAWPGVVAEFAPEPVGKGPRVHCMVREPGGVRVEFVYTPSA